MEKIKWEEEEVMELGYFFWVRTWLTCIYSESLGISKGLHMTLRSIFSRISMESAATVWLCLSTAGTDHHQYP